VAGIAGCTGGTGDSSGSGNSGDGDTGTTTGQPNTGAGTIVLGGSIFALVAIGFALVWGVVGIINLAHGEMMMLGGYVSYWAFLGLTGTGTGPGLLVLATVPVAVAVLYVVGYGLQRAIVTRVTDEDMFLTLLVTFGLSIFIQQATLQAFSADPRSIGATFADPSFVLGGIVVPKMKLVAFVGTLALAAALYVYLQTTRRGRAIRAVAQNPEAARLVGIDVQHTRAVTFGLSAAVAGGAGAFIATILNVTPQIGLNYTLKSFVIVVFGGIGSIPGALVGGLLLGTVEELTAGLVSSQLTLAVTFTLLVVLLVVKPQGLFGSDTEGST
jgi:branched-chain amino acid transport system permease protein